MASLESLGQMWACGLPKTIGRDLFGCWLSAFVAAPKLIN